MAFAHKATSVLFGTAVAEERAKFAVAQVVILVAHFGANGTHALAVDHGARMTVIPVLIDELLPSAGESAQPIVQRLLVSRLFCTLLIVHLS